MGIGVHGVRQSVEHYRLPTLWCIHFYRYEAVVFANGHRLEIHPGSVSVFPPGTRLEYRYRGRSVHAYAHFHLAGGGASQTMPAAQEGADLRPSFEEAIGWMPARRRAAEARLWDILWQLARPEAPAVHPGVAAALRLIELRLGGVIYVHELAAAAGLSPNHLTRLFTAATGKTVVAYIRDRRVQRAVHLLRHSTLPVKTIAAEVGIPDLHLFNKCVRRALGVAPRRVRRGRRAR
jgi:AraC-like DNA-binding protein